MSVKLRTLGPLLLVAIAVASATSATATGNGEGHFVTDLEHVTIDGAVLPDVHKLHYLEHGIVGEIGCKSYSHKATAISPTKTVTELVVTPGYGECYTTPEGSPGSVTIHVNGCTYKFTVAKGTTNTTEQTMHLQCPAGSPLKITHPNCTITIHPQTIGTGITYTKGFGATHFITMDLNVQVATTRHGLCQFLGTFGVGTFKGQLIVSAFRPNTVELRNLTAT